MVTASFMISEGCILVMPSGIHRRAPFTPLPICGISTITSSRSDSTNSLGAHLSQVLIGIRKTNIAATRPTTSDTMWRRRKWLVVYDEYLGESGIAIDAE